LNAHDCTIEYLEIQGKEGRGQLKSDINQLVVDLMSNVNLKFLDISGNGAGLDILTLYLFFIYYLLLLLLFFFF